MIRESKNYRILDHYVRLDQSYIINEARVSGNTVWVRGNWMISGSF